MAVVFVPTPDGLYDLEINGRSREYDVEPDDFDGALRRARLTDEIVYVEDQTGHRTPLRRRRLR